MGCYWAKNFVIFLQTKTFIVANCQRVPKGYNVVTDGRAGDVAVMEDVVPANEPGKKSTHQQDFLVVFAVKSL